MWISKLFALADKADATPQGMRITVEGIGPEHLLLTVSILFILCAFVFVWKTDKGKWIRKDN